MKSPTPIIPAINICYKKPLTLCELRQWSDSEFLCDKDGDKYCQWREKPKDKNGT